MGKSFISRVPDLYIPNLFEGITGNFPEQYRKESHFMFSKNIFEDSYRKKIIPEKSVFSAYYIDIMKKIFEAQIKNFTLLYNKFSENSEIIRLVLCQVLKNIQGTRNHRDFEENQDIKLLIEYIKKEIDSKQNEIKDKPFSKQTDKIGKELSEYESIINDIILNYNSIMKSMKICDCKAKKIYERFEKLFSKIQYLCITNEEEESDSETEEESTIDIKSLKRLKNNLIIFNDEIGEIFGKSIELYRIFDNVIFEKGNFAQYISQMQKITFILGGQDDWDRLNKMDDVSDSSPYQSYYGDPICIDHIFYYCIEQEKIALLVGVEDDISNVMIPKNVSKNENENYDVVKIKGGAFRNKENIKFGFAFDSKVKVIEKKAFENVINSLITIPNSVEYLEPGWLFNSSCSIAVCSKNKKYSIIDETLLVQKVNIDEDNYSELNILSEHCGDTVSIPSFIKSILPFTFNVIEETNFTIKFSNNVVKFEENAFNGSRIENLNILSDSNPTIYIEENVFNGSRIENLNISGKLKPTIYIKKNAFNGSSIESITVSENSNLTIYIEKNAFDGSSIENFTVSKNSTPTIYIEKNIFDCLDPDIQEQIGKYVKEPPRPPPEKQMQGLTPEQYAYIYI